MKFADRSGAGRRLAGKLLHLKDRRPVVLALPRGGVAVGFEIAQTLGAPLDIVLVQKIGVPWQPELALGAVTDGADPLSLSTAIWRPRCVSRRLISGTKPHAGSRKSSDAGNPIAQAVRLWKSPGA